MLQRPSPCLSCARVKDPRDCENKNCQLWRRWFIARWEGMREAARQQMNIPPEKVGITLSGQTYASAHQVREYLRKDPCEGCVCPQNLCKEPCTLKANWLAARKDVLL